MRAKRQSLPGRVTGRRTYRSSLVPTLDLIAVTAFGLESVAVRELAGLGYEAKPISTGRVLFKGDAKAICRCNLRLRSVDRLLVRMGTFEAKDFGVLFDATTALPWHEWIPKDGEFPVNGRSVKSQLSSVPACQKIVKKAIVEQLRRGHKAQNLLETGATFSIEVSLLNDVATLTLDTSGAGLHKRGYRDLVGDAAMKETLAASLVLLSVWRPERPLIDPFCGTGTIAIEAAMIGLNIAPGINRSFDSVDWPIIPGEAWDEAEQEARDLATGRLAYTIHASDISESALGMARRHAARAGVERQIHFTRKDFADLSSKAEYGCIITNPPWGERMGDDVETERLYRSFPAVLRRFPTWSHHILTARQDLEFLVGQEASRRRKLFNASIECTYYTFLGPRPPEDAPRHAGPGSQEQPAEPVAREDVPADPSTETPASQPLESPRDAEIERLAREQQPAQAFGGLRERDLKESREFAACLSKNARHLRKYPSRGITCYRVYERDCPDVPLIVDRYEDRVHAVEYEREHSRTIAQQADWFELMKRTISEVLELPEKNVIVKPKPRQRGLLQHERVAERGEIITAHEAGLKFEVNLSDYIDTGLFLDHRLTRAMVREQAARKRFLNLFCYTGSFTVYAAAGGATSTTSVDLSNTYLDWARRNMELNGFRGPQHRFIRSDVIEFLERHERGPHYDLAVVDPPTFSNSKSTEEDWEVQVGHTRLLKAVIAQMSPGGVIYFSNNFRRFKLAEEEFAGVRIREISKQTVPPEYRNDRIHRCWRMVVE